MVGARLEGGEQGRPVAWSSPARASAVISACGPPGGAVGPSKVRDGSTPETTTQPTQGLGAVVPRTESAGIARCITPRRPHVTVVCR